MNNKLWNCTICNKNYKSYQSLWIHKKKFHIPEVKSPAIYKCKYCNLEFNERHTKYYHQKKCNLNNIITNTNTIPDNVSNVTNITNISNTTNNITNNIIINNYTNDNIDYISEKFKDRLFNQILLKNYSIPLPNLIENIKFNPNHKENNNVKITNIRSKIGFYYDKNKWIAINKNQLLNELCDYSLKVFLNYFDQNKQLLNNEIKENFNIFTREIKSKLKDGIKSKIENIAYIFTLNNILDK